MNSIRFKALEVIQNRNFVEWNNHKTKHSEIFGQYVFEKDAMKKFLPREAFDNLMKAIDKGEKIGRNTADLVASGMQNWAINHGATHYTHWFQPLTGLTAEKHDAFFEISDGKGIENFSGSALIQQEPDASSFPSGGIRNTFEARGYTAWDPSSPAFLMKTPSGLTLCIPTVFISYTGEALDYKTPLLKALHFLENSVVEVCKYFDDDVNRAFATLGVEQEYFLVDAALYNAREDLFLTKRTLMGRPPAKGQQLDDHYFGSIPERVHAFMVDFEREAMKLGIPIKTRHNEVAPSQFECAPMYEEVNLAVDHNQVMMDIIDKIAKRHQLRAILHEKPFAKVNGSGKHCNWSIQTNTGDNLLSPGKTKKSNLRFLTFFINTIKAVADHSDILRASIANAGNDHRLGANEAPPAIISVFIGSQLTEVLKQMENKKSLAHHPETLPAEELDMDIPKVPELLLDNTDRNRTSPFAFTGNKFEFRATGSSLNTASPMIALNTMVASQLKNFKKEVDDQIENGKEQDHAIIRTLRSYLKDTQKILFEGNNYSEEWVKEAKERGLPNISNTPEALDSYIEKPNQDLFIENNILTEKELKARHQILLDHYTKHIQIEARVLGEMALGKVIPPALQFQNNLSRYLLNLREMDIDEGQQEIEITFKKNARHIQEIKKNVYEMIQERKKANNITDQREQALTYCFKIKPYLDTIRYHAEKLELNVNDDMWLIPKYRELLFLR